MPKFRNRNEYVKWKAKIEEEIKIKVDHTPPEPQEPQEPTGVYNPTPQTRHIARTSFNDELSDVFTYPF
ncbi:MAG: hypothetical protein GWO07_08640 [Candidatus Dadabacteria bacterium]|nr:hypothetical protein [Candidatus Dadabacteria bacterium]NIS08814.1 hypothetical protein [Candidatus Dadabacteria bacterium]NIY22164.1 hypothetical protein [Candidatus Dadabacteria bacterium]